MIRFCAIVNFSEIKAFGFVSEDVRIQIDKGKLYANSGNFTQAINYYDRALNIDPNHTNALTDNGEALGNLGIAQESIVYFDKVLKIDPDNVPALNDKGISLADLGKYGEAIVYFDKSLKINGSNIHAMSNKTRVFYALGRYEVSKIEPNDVFALNHKGKALFSLEKYAEASYLFDKALAVLPVIQVGKGLILTYSQDFAKAIEYFDKVLSIDPNNPYALKVKNIIKDTVRNKLVFYDSDSRIIYSQVFDSLLHFILILYTWAFQLEPGRYYLSKKGSVILSEQP